MAQWVKNLLAEQETQEMWVQSLGREPPLEEEMATHYGILAWRIPWTEEPGGATTESNTNEELSTPNICIRYHGTFVTVEKPTLTHHYHTNPVVSTRVCSQCCTSLGFWQVNNDLHLLLRWHSFTALSSLCALLIHLSLHLDPCQPQIFLMSS